MSAIINDLKQLYELLAQCEYREHVIHVLNYDMETAAPRGGMEDDGRDISIFSSEIFKIKKSGDFLLLVNKLYKQEYKKLNVWDQRLVTLLYRDLQRDKNISPDLNKRMTQLFNSAYITWIKAKEKNDYSLFKDKLKAIYEIEKEAVTLRDNHDSKNLYSTLLSDYEEGFTVKDLDKFFDELEAGIKPLLAAIRKAKYQPRHDFLNRPVPIAKQEEFSNYLLKFNGFDFERGSLSTTEHPFTDQFSLNDVRVTTHYYETNFISNIYSIIHEGGHALFGQNIPEDVYTHHLGEGVLSMAKHESVSRFYENVIGRSKEYIHAIYPYFHKLFEKELGDVSEDDLYEGVNYVDLNNSLRTEADELTYSLHIIIRYRLEKMMMEGKADFDTLDQEWNRLYKEILGIENKDAKTGILQDVHWTSGFGYFPTYAMGNALNCIYAKKIDADINLKKTVKNGDMKKVLSWMRENVFAKAPLYDTKEWIKKISGEPFSSKDYIYYLKEKFMKLYHIKKLETAENTTSTKKGAKSK